MGHEQWNDEIQQAETGRNLVSSFSLFSSSFRSTSDVVAAASSSEDDQVKLQWAAIERLPTCKRVRKSLFDHNLVNDSSKEENHIIERKVIDVTELGPLEHHLFIDKLITRIENDNLRLLNKLKQRIQRQEPLFLFLSLF